jgi:hypothetical protein
MIRDFEFVIYDTPEIIVNGVRWYLAPYYTYEIEVFAQYFKEGTDYIQYIPWENAYGDGVFGFDVLFNSKIFTWMSLKYGQADVEQIYGEVNINMIIKTIEHDSSLIK